MTVESLKKEARRHEQREEWAKALDLYLQAIERQVDGEEPDIALHNRVGDLQVRLGDLEGAVASYEQAIQLYMDTELPNNAIAVCRKIVRHDPERPTSFLRMGQIRAKQGFVEDARQNFITYAEMMQVRGEPDEALRALEEFAGLAPEDVETRLFLAEQLVSRSRPNEALYYLSEAYRTSVAQDDSTQAEEITSRITEIDPDYRLPSVDQVDAAVGPEEEAVPDAPWSDGQEPGVEGSEGPAVDGIALDDGEPSAFEGDDGWTAEEVSFEEGEPPEAAFGEVDLEAAEVEIEASRAGTSEEDAGDRWSGELDGLELTGLGEEAVEAPPELGDDLELTTLGDGSGEPVVADVGDDLELEHLGELGEEDVGSEVADHEPSPSAMPDELSLDGAFALDEDEEEDAAEEPLPLLHFDPDELDVMEGEEPDVAVPSSEGPSLDRVATLRDRVAETPGDADAWRELGEALFGEDDASAAWEAMDRAHELYAEQGDPERAMRVVRELLIHDPQRIELRQRVVEYAHQTKERTLLVQAFLELADGLRAEGEELKANAVFEQVLEIDPGNIRANEALSDEAPVAASGTAEPDPVAGYPGDLEPGGDGESTDYVDLGAMVLESDGEETTRWVVEEDAPTGDEEADFARMLSQFKEKVAENISTDDARSHYDLGTAYKEMGLFNEAIGEFQQALRGDPTNLATFEMLGQCFLDRGDPEVAIRTLERGLQLPSEVEDEFLGVYYWLAQAHEAVGNPDTAREFYERVFSLDINFKDVIERLKALR